ncbi:pyridoxamine 5'-phosphate oxidase [Pseudoduganella umbonata]|uniref:Pyridoxine/pyridoxamine 5'-phosphate oxidase n=1 Tax=Pseudoduganella umbonata TaxID=864828 RepID=A0A4P8HS25_9BURK|nr:pyridoxamine 5'-phosphate oxidase [Pseudoduganella umbonata]MBB3220481.1 pyridoxamine 5'-phosphate oxidase [Pseudoduganella umbonata]QCP11996.1 pyridoxamine 5'-phosphate oxidase [Pseudoduganella umbonata]
MTDFLPAPAPGFDQPIAVLKHCHDKIRQQLATLQNLLTHLPRHGADAAAQQAAQAVQKYFNKAAHVHHADEEIDLLPMLDATATGTDLETVRRLRPEILQQHQQMDEAWHVLDRQLDKIASGSAGELSADAVNTFVSMYTAHMETEEGHIAPMAKRLFNPAQMAVLGESMRRRRGIDSPAADGNSGGGGSGGNGGANGGSPAAGGIALADLRMDYGRASLSEDDTLADPVAQFGKWFDEAMKAQVNEPNAMSVATVGSDGKPSSRIVLIKQFDVRGFTWYTNYESLKGRQLAENPHAAILFFWPELERQVRIEGRVERTSAAESDTYFYSRPVKSQLAAIASMQSAPIGSRADMEANYAAVERAVAAGVAEGVADGQQGTRDPAAGGGKPQRPAHWGGYRLVPERIEFWQGRASRFHDRIVYTLQADGSWSRGRIQP